MRKILTFVALIAWVNITGSISHSGSSSRAKSLEQTSVAQTQTQRKISVNSDLVVLPVTVKDQNGNLVAGLEQQDFRVFDDDSEQTINVFASEASPLSLVLLIDDDLKSKDAA